MDLFAEGTSTHGGVGQAVAGGDRYPFGRVIAEVESAVVESCAGEEEWPARIAAGIDAVVDFAVAEPAAARVLAIDSRAGGAERRDYDEMIDRFAGLLGAGAPRPERLSASTDQSIVSMIASIVSCHLRAGSVDSLGRGEPDLVFFALLPYVGFAEANRWSSRYMDVPDKPTAHAVDADLT